MFINADYVPSSRDDADNEGMNADTMIRLIHTSNFVARVLSENRGSHKMLTMYLMGKVAQSIASQFISLSINIYEDVKIIGCNNPVQQLDPRVGIL